jgi:mannose-1-phosphate guanylyltransferase
MLHAIKAVSDLRLIEVQIGEELTEEDIERFEWEWEES